jgi:glucose/arabinose dehydrogenase
MRRARISLLAGAAALLLAGCGSQAGSSAPTWEPSPDFGSNGEGPGVQLTPILPVPSLGPRSSQAGNPNGSGSPAAPSPNASGKTDPLVVATHLTAPVGLTMMPDNTALVGERTTGRIVRVQPKPNQPVPTVRTIAGLDTSGDGGLLDLALSPSYDEDSLIYAYITTRTDNRVVDFTLHGPVTPVLTGIPKGSTGNTGRIAFGDDGDLYVGTGDAGHGSLAADPASLGGKVLRVSSIGKPAPGNPRRSSPVWTSGHHVVDGLCPVPQSSTVLETESARANESDEVNLLAGGDFYGWPTNAGTVEPPVAQLPSADRSPGGCAVADGSLYVTSLDGRALLAAQLTGAGSRLTVAKFAPELSGKYGRLRTVVAADDGALWLTTSNRDGSGAPVPTDERVIRYVPSGSGGGKNPA